jgi:hypothetical protein
MALAVVSMASTNAEVAEFFPFADNFIEVDRNFNLEELSSFRYLLELIPENINYIIFNNSLQKKYKLSDFFTDNGSFSYQYKMLQRKDWDLSRSSWVTGTFVNSNAERIFNARDIVYRQYGVNFRFFIEKKSCFICSVASIKKAIKLCEKNKLDIENVHGSLVAYLDFFEENIRDFYLNNRCKFSENK